MEELYAKILTVERLLILLLSDPKYEQLMDGFRSDIWTEFEEPMNKFFPSDKEYQTLRVVVDNLKYAADRIEINQRYWNSE